MPRFDGTGPMGMGSMTGRGAGYCIGYATPMLGYGMGYGRGRGFRRMFYLTGRPGWSRYDVSESEYVPVLDEKDFLSNQEELLENQLEQVRKQLKKLNDGVNNEE